MISQIRPSSGGRPKRLFCVAALCLGLAGCSLIGRQSSPSDDPRSALTQPLTRQKREKSSGSWFIRRESTSSERIEDFLAMPRLDQ